MKKIYLHLIILAFAVSLNAQWQPDVRLTNAPDWSSTTFYNAWAVA